MKINFIDLHRKTHTFCADISLKKQPKLHFYVYRTKNQIMYDNYFQKAFEWKLENNLNLTASNIFKMKCISTVALPSLDFPFTLSEYHNLKKFPSFLSIRDRFHKPISLEILVVYNINTNSYNFPSDLDTIRQRTFHVMNDAFQAYHFNAIHIQFLNNAGFSITYGAFQKLNDYSDLRNYTVS